MKYATYPFCSDVIVVYLMKNYGKCIGKLGPD